MPLVAPMLWLILSGCSLFSGPAPDTAWERCAAESESLTRRERDVLQQANPAGLPALPHTAWEPQGRFDLPSGLERLRASSAHQSWYLVDSPERCPATVSSGSVIVLASGKLAGPQLRSGAYAMHYDDDLAYKTAALRFALTRSAESDLGIRPAGADLRADLDVPFVDLRCSQSGNTNRCRWSIQYCESVSSTFEDCGCPVAEGGSGPATAEGGRCERDEPSPSDDEDPPLAPLDDTADDGSEAADTDSGPAESDLTNGARVFHDTCAVCHGDNGTGLGSASDLSEVLPQMSDDEVKEVIRHGAPGMPSFRSTLSDDEIRDVIAYIRDSEGEL